jgi:hypothetical protein
MKPCAQSPSSSNRSARLMSSSPCGWQPTAVWSSGDALSSSPPPSPAPAAVTGARVGSAAPPDPAESPLPDCLPHRPPLPAPSARAHAPPAHAVHTSVSCAVHTSRRSEDGSTREQTSQVSPASPPAPHASVVQHCHHGSPASGSLVASPPPRSLSEARAPGAQAPRRSPVARGCKTLVCVGVGLIPARPESP